MSGEVNSVGDETWKVSDLTRLRRFLCYGAEGGTMFIDEKDIGRESAQSIMRLLDDGRGLEVVTEITQFSTEGKAAKQEPLLFALAMCVRLSPDVAVKQAAWKVLPEVCRTPSQLFTFVKLSQSLCEPGKSKGWGRAQRNAICAWYNDKEPKLLAMQVTKYIQRSRWSHVDLLRLAHIRPKNDAIAVIFRYMTKGLEAAKLEYGKDSADNEIKSLLEYLEAVHNVKHTDDEQLAARLIDEHALAWEHVPTNLLKSTEVRGALLAHMPIQAMIRQLGKLTALGMLDPLSPHAKTVIDRLSSEETIRSSRLHPFNLLVAVKTYSSGKAEKGKTKWKANSSIVDALNKAFICSFKNMTPTSKRYLIVVDVSKSMQAAGINGYPSVSPVTCAGAMAMMVARSEKHYQLLAVAGEKIKEVPLRPDLPLQNISVGILGASEKVRSGPTNCSLPIKDALQKKKPVDVFIIFTDSETMSEEKPSEALKKYRDEMGIPDARLVVCSLTNNAFSLADPDDPGMLDVVGFDPSVPLVISQFVSGQL